MPFAYTLEHREHDLNYSKTVDNLFLPNFCDVRMVLALVVIAQLLAFVLILGPYNSSDRWTDLSLISLFIQWIALTSAALLCLSRPLLRKVGNITAACLSYILLIAVTVLISEVMYWLLQSNAFSAVASAPWHRDFLLRNIGISAIVSAIALRYFYVQHQWKKNLESETNSRIQALQARIRPHFLFNCMNTIASLTRSQPQVAEATIQNLADLFRASLGDSQLRVPLCDELELSRKYLQIEQLRLGERLNVVWNMSDVPQDALIPSLTVQPLAENAIYHGIERLSEGGTIRITGRQEKNLIHIIVDNPVLQSNASARAQGNGMAMQNIRQRLEAYYGNQGKLVVGHPNKHSGRYVVQISFPYVRSTT
jgi:two-component system sensor histidine kinase AlgZ